MKPLYVVFALLMLLYVACASDSEPMPQLDGDLDITEVSDTTDLAEGLLCDPFDLDEAPWFGMETPATRTKAMAFSSWQTIDFAYDYQRNTLNITGLWINKLPLCACGYEIPGSGQMVSGDQDVLDFITVNGIGQGSGIITIELDLTTGNSRAVKRNILMPEFIPAAPSNIAGDVFDITVNGMQDAVSLSLFALSGYDLRGCPTSDVQQTRSILTPENSGFGNLLHICGTDEQGETDCEFPAAVSEQQSITPKVPGTYICDENGCRADESAGR